MKKLFALLLVFVLVVGMLAGCAPKEEAPAEEPTTEAPATEEPATEEPVEITAKELMKSVNARKAMALAIDKSYVTDVILANGSIPADYFVPSGLASDENGDDFRAAYPDGWLHYNVEEAQSYWAKAKEELGFDTVAIEFLTYDSETSKKISEFIQGQLQDTLEGLSVTLNQQPFKNKLDLAAQGEYEIQFAGWGPDYPDPMTFMDMWVTGGGHNDAGYSSPVFDENIQRTKSGDLTADLAARWALLQETEELLINQDAVLVPMYQRAGAVLRQPYVTGIVKHGFGGDYTYKYADTTLLTEGKKIIRLLDSSDIPSMDTNKATDSVSFELMSNVLEGLFSLGENDVVEMGVAKEFTVSEDGLTYTFMLREDAVWSNGTPVTAHDFVYSWRRLVDPATGSQYAFMGETAALANAAAIAAGEADVDTLGVEATDDYTLVATLDVPVPFFTKLLTFPNFYPVNQAFVESLEADTFGTTIDTTLFNGPFVLSQWELGYGQAMAKNDMYWNADVVMIDGVTYRIVKDAAAGINLYETGEVDRAGLSGEFVEQYIDDPNYYEVTDTVLFYLVFNINNTGQNAH
jgi:oligopeptide transport system substrate-binding protein